jgi:hypothetical protein
VPVRAAVSVLVKGRAILTLTILKYELNGR